MSSDNPSQLNDYQKYELQKVAARGKNTTTLVALVYPPAAYYLVNKKGIAAFCFLTAHFGLLAHLVAPFHTRRVITKSREQLNAADSSDGEQVSNAPSSDGSPLLIILGVVFILVMILAVVPLILGIFDIGL